MKAHTLRIYKSRKVEGQWGWSLIAPNGKKVATGYSGELYKSKAHALKIAQSMVERFAGHELKLEEKRVRVTKKITNPVK